MTKYDEFGRPIFETAEEYNKAKNTRSAPRTYDSPEGDSYQHNTYKQTKKYEKAAERYEKQTGPKKGRKYILILVAVILITQIAVVFMLFRTTSGIYDRYEENWYEEDWVDSDDDDENSGYGGYIGDDAQPLPENFNTFSYNGETYMLPTTYQEIAKMGFTLEEEYDGAYMFPSEYEALLNLNDEDGYLAGMIRIKNYTDTELPLEQCVVDYFYLSNDAAYSDEEVAPDFVFGDGLTFESSYADLEAYFGAPYYHFEDHEEGYYYDNYEWAYYGDDEIHFVSITFWNGIISDISIEKKAYEPKY